MEASFRKSKIYLGTTVAAAIATTAVSNANPAIATLTHTYSANDFVVVRSGWEELDNKLVRLSAVSTTVSATLEGIDTTSTTTYPALAGVGTLAKVSTFTNINEILDFTITGGDMGTQEYDFLSSNRSVSYDTIFSAMTAEITVSSDSTKAGYIALKAANDAGTDYPLKIVMKGGKLLCYMCSVSFNENPIASGKDGVPGCKAMLRIKNAVVTYAS